MDPEQMELIVALVRAAQAQDNIREETGLLESKKDANPEHAQDARKLSGQQDQLYWMIDELREKTKFTEVKPTLQAVEGMMQEVTTDLRKPQTDEPVASLQGTIIELLVPPDKKGGKPRLEIAADDATDDAADDGPSLASREAGRQQFEIDEQLCRRDRRWRVKRRKTERS